MATQHHTHPAMLLVILSAALFLLAAHIPFTHGGAFSLVGIKKPGKNRAGEHFDLSAFDFNRFESVYQNAPEHHGDATNTDPAPTPARPTWHSSLAPYTPRPTQPKVVNYNPSAAAEQDREEWERKYSSSRFNPRNTFSNSRNENPPAFAPPPPPPSVFDDNGEYSPSYPSQPRSRWDGEDGVVVSDVAPTPPITNRQNNDSPTTPGGYVDYRSFRSGEYPQRYYDPNYYSTRAPSRRF